MRHFITLLLLATFLSATTAAQNEALDSINLQLRQLFSPLARPANPKLFLYDMAAHVTDSSFFQVASPDTSNTDIWHKVYEEMFHAAYDTTQLVHPEDLLLQANGFYADTIPIGILNYSYYFFKDDALTTDTYFNFDTVNTVLTDKSPRPDFPYNESSLFIAAPLVSSSRFANPIFRIDPQFILYDVFNSAHFSNSDYLLKIDFGDGNGWVTINPSVVTHHQVGYTTAEEHIIRVGIFSREGQPIASSQTRIIVPTTAVNIPPDEVLDFAGVRAGLYRNCNGRTLSGKTVIYVEGFDLMDFIASQNRTASEIYTSMIQRDQIVQLRNQGYSFLVVDWRNSRIDMRFNALYLVNMLNQLKCQITDQEQFVIMGESMGGVVARYALAYMESVNYQNRDDAPFFQDQFDVNNILYLSLNPGIRNLVRNWCREDLMHNTRLLITLDAPHQGANIPVSLQKAYRHAMNIFGKYIGAALKLAAQATNLFLDGQAAQQLLIYHIDNESGSGFYKTYDRHNDREAFMNQLLELGNYPQFAKVMLLSNGALNGEPQTNWYTGQPRQANDRLLDFHASLYARVLWFRVPIFGGDLTARTNPNGNGHIFNAQAGFYGIRIKLKWFGIKIKIGYNSLLFRDDYANTQAYCTASGGFFGQPRLVDPNASQSGYDLSGSWLFNLFSYRYTVTGTGCVQFRSHAGLNGFLSANFDYSICSDGFHFNFIPTQSALDYGQVGAFPALGHDIENGDDIFTKLATTSPTVDVISGIPQGLFQGNFKNYPHLFRRNDQVFNLTRTSSSPPSSFENTYFSCAGFEDRVRRQFLNLEIGDEELYLENNTLNWAANYTAEYDLHVNDRNPYYEYATQPPGSVPNMLAGIYSKEEDFIINNNGFATFTYDPVNTPTGIGFNFTNPNGNWTEVQQPLDHCCVNLAQARRVNFVTKKSKEKKTPVSYALIYPNPNRGDQAVIKYKFKRAGKVFLDLVNVHGQQVYRLVLNIPDASKEITSVIPMQQLQLTPGLYLVRLTNGTQVLVSKLIVGK